MAVITFNPTPQQRLYLAACGCSQCNTCTHCAIAPATWTFTLAGIAPGCAECAAFNTDYALSFASNCQWEQTLNFGCVLVKAIIIIVNGSNMQLVFNDAGNVTRLQYSKLTAINCLGSNVLTRTVDLGDCSNTPLTVTVSAA